MLNDILLKEIVSVPPGCRLAPSASSASLLLSHPRPLPLAPLPHVDRAPQRRLVLPAVDAFHFHGDAPRAGRRAPRPVGVSFRQHGAAALLAVRQHHGDASSPLLCAHVPDGNQGCDLYETRGGHRRLDVADSTATSDADLCWTKKFSETTFKILEFTGVIGCGTVTVRLDKYAERVQAKRRVS